MWWGVEGWAGGIEGGKKEKTQGHGQQCEYDNCGRRRVCGGAGGDGGMNGDRKKKKKKETKSEIFEAYNFPF